MTTSESKLLSVEIVDAEGGATVVRLSGELDLATAPELDDCLLLLAGTDVVVDVSGLTFMDSSGISCIVAAYKRAQAAECSLVLRGPAGAVARALQVTGVDGVLAVEAAD